MVEGIQGVAGIFEPDTEFLRELRKLCDKYGTLLICDEVQSGYGRTGQFYAHQASGVRADIVSMAKGMGNGFPIGGIIISPAFKPSFGMLGTTFGGSHLACTAALAVLKVMNEEHLMDNAARTGKLIIDGLKGNKAIKEIRGRGLIIGIELIPEYTNLRDKLLFEKHIFTGGAGENIIRILPPLTLSSEEAEIFINAFNDLTK